MTEQELKTYSELQIKFAEDVKRVAHILNKIDYELTRCQDFYLNKGTVYTHGIEFYGGQDWEEFYGEFPAEMLMWSNEKLQNHVNEVLQKQKAEELAKKLQQAKQEEQKERQELVRLKAKYEML